MRAEQISLAKRYNYLPYRFKWRGIHHDVQRIERHWSSLRRRSDTPRHYFKVRCDNNRVYTIFQDVRLNAWFVQR